MIWEAVGWSVVGIVVVGRLAIWLKAKLKRPPACEHEWLVGNPTDEKHRGEYAKWPAVCRWCSEKTALDFNDAHIAKEHNRLRKVRALYPAGDIPDDELKGSK